MNVKKSLSALLISGATIALLAVSLPAHAAPPALPPGDQLVAASCDDEYGTSTFIKIDAATGASTPVGAGNPGYECAYQQAWDATTNTLYGMIYDSNSVLVKWDYTTGVLTEIGAFFDTDNATAIYPDSIVIALNGSAYAIEGLDLYQVNLSTATVTLLGAIAGADSSIYGAAVDPSTGLIYGLEQSGDLLLIDPVALTGTPAGTWPISTDWSYGLAIDRAGTAWVVESPGDGTYSALWSTPLATFGVAPQLSGNIVDADGDDPITWWATIIYPPVPALADTGFDAAPLALGGFLLAVLGVVLVTRRSRRTI